MNTADQLIAGYTAYTDASELGASASAGGDAPASTPTALSVVVSVLSVEDTFYWGC